MKSLSERKAPDQDHIKSLTKEMEEVSKTIDKNKKTIVPKVFEEMQKVLNLLTKWSTAKDNAEEIMITDEEEKVAKALLAKMYYGLRYDCWNLEGVAHNENVDSTLLNIVEADKSIPMDIDDNIEEEEKEKDIVKMVCEYNSDTTDVQIIVDAKQPALERVATLAKLAKIDEPTVLIKLAGYAGFGETDEQVMENLCFTLHELFHHWVVDPHVVEKLIADKIETRMGENPQQNT